jgi:hypothetical protein
VDKNMMEYLFGNKNIEKVLFFILENEKCYATELQKRFGDSLSGFQQALLKLEKGGVLVSIPEGKTRLFQFNPLYPFRDELQSFLKKAYEFLPASFREKYYEPKIRKRPRRTGKPL